MITWPHDLIEDIAKRKCVIYLGAGVSANSQNDAGRHPATWDAFLRDIIRERRVRLRDFEAIILGLLEKENFLMACEVMINILGERDFGELSANEFRRPGYRPCELHNIIFSLDSKIVITPNIDKIYDQYATTSSNGTVIIKTYKEDIARYLRSPDYLIIKAHGTIDDTDSIIFTHGQYSRARNQYSNFYRILDALMLTHTFVFLGCGISDPDIQLVLEDSHFSYPGCRPHYIITDESTIIPKVKDCISQNRNIEFLTYENPDGQHIQLLENLKVLDSLVADKRQDIALRTAW